MRHPPSPQSSLQPTSQQLPSHSPSPQLSQPAPSSTINQQDPSSKKMPHHTTGLSPSTQHLSYSNVLSGKHSPATSEPILNSLISLVNDLKNLITPILTLITQLTNALSSNAK